MRYCNRCKVNIENDLDECPLCGQKTLKRGNKFKKDFPSQSIVEEDISKKIMKLLVFVFLALIGSNIAINFLFSFKLIWAPYSIVVLFYAYLIVRSAMKSYKNIGTIVMINVYMLSIIGFILDLLLGYSGWSIDYLIPILIMSGIIALVIFICIRPIYFINYFIYMLIIALFGLTLLIFLWLDFINIRIPTVFAIFISAMSIIGMFMFGDERIKNEFIKRFHF